MLLGKCTSCGCGNILNKLLCCMPAIKIPLGQNHYVTPCGISIFSNIMCVENSLNCLTKNVCNSLNNCNCTPNCFKCRNLLPK